MRNYILNPETLLYEIKEVSLKSRLFKGLLLFVGSVLLAAHISDRFPCPYLLFPRA